MPSSAFTAFEDALSEVADLTQFKNFSRIAPRSDHLRLGLAIGRSSVVLLSSHFERYLYAINEEAIEWLNQRRIVSQNIPENIRLLHAAHALESINKMQWDRRSDALVSFVSTDSWLWVAGSSGSIMHDRLLIWMKAPNPKNLVRYYKYWGIEDIFKRITRSEIVKRRLWLEVNEFVDARNSIAHGDTTVQPTIRDVKRYMNTAREFCSRSDRAFAAALKRISGGPSPW